MISTRILVRHASLALLTGAVAGSAAAQAKGPLVAHCTFTGREAHTSTAGRNWLFSCTAQYPVTAQTVVTATEVGFWFRGAVLNDTAKGGYVQLFYKSPRVAVPTDPSNGWALEQVIFSSAPESQPTSINSNGAMISRSIVLPAGDSSQTWMLKSLTLRRTLGVCSRALQESFP